jgi:hypothetical protein
MSQRTVSGEPLDLDRLRKRAEKFLIEMEEESFKNWVGLLDKFETGKIYHTYKDLFTRNTVLALKKFAPKTAEESRRLRSLLGLFVYYYMEYKTRRECEELTNLQLSSLVKFGDETIAYRSIGPKIVQERDRERRIALSRKRRNLRTRKLNPVQKKIFEHYFQIIKNLGYSDYIELASQTQDQDLEGFAKTMTDFIEESDDLYLKYLERFLKKDLDVELEKADTTDLLFFRNFKKYNKYFPGERLIPVLKETLLGMGFNLDKQNNIHLDTEPRPNKIPRACVSAIHPPFDVRLTVYPTGGYSDFVDIFHESGHAEHFAHDREDLEFEYKYWGDRGFTEGMAYLFQNITLHSLWMEKVTGLKEYKDLLKRCAFLQLFSIRRLASDFLFEMELFAKQKLDGMSSRYARIMTRGTGVKYAGDGYLDLDLEFYSAGYARARIFEVQLRKYLEKNFGDDWWRKRETGSFLKRYWREGRKWKAQEVLLDLGYKGLDPSYYLEDVKQYLK